MKSEGWRGLGQPALLLRFTTTILRGDRRGLAVIAERRDQRG
jgi:hypothetical protein